MLRAISDNVVIASDTGKKERRAAAVHWFIHVRRYGSTDCRSARFMGLGTRPAANTQARHEDPKPMAGSSNTTTIHNQAEHAKSKQTPKKGQHMHDVACTT